MSQNAVLSQGVQILRGNSASPIAYTAIAEVVGISRPGAATPQIDVSDLSSVIKEFNTGLREGGRITLSMFLRPGHQTQTDIQTDFNAGSTNTQPWRILLADSPQHKRDFNAYVEQIGDEIAVDQAATVSVTLVVTGTDSGWTTV